MPKCSYCGTKEVKNTPLCNECGALRYPVSTTSQPANGLINTQDKLKLSATIAAAILTPGSLIVLAVVGANRLNSKIKNRK